MQFLTFRRGEVIYHEGDTAEAFFVILEGACGATHGSDGLIRSHGPGDLVGAMPLFQVPGKRQITLRVTSEEVGVRDMQGLDLMRTDMLTQSFMGVFWDTATLVST